MKKQHLMSTKYNRKDHLYKEAKNKGLRSRAYYKLEELDQKHNLFRKGQRVVDLGAWPGGWLQYAAKRVGEQGLVVGIDLNEIEPLRDKNVQTICGDLSNEATISQALELSNQPYDLLLSDMSAKLTGIKESDQARAVGLTELALYCASKLLRNGGNLVIKVFKGGEIDQLINDKRQYFDKLARVGLKSTRKTSNEFYLLGTGFKTLKYRD